MARNILIVDDQEDILLVLEREFRRKAGMTVVTASTSGEALALMAQRQIDFVISDVRLGKDSGFDLVREIKRALPTIGTILITAYRSAANRQQAETLGVVLFLEKPFQISRLIEEVENYFHRLENPATVMEVPAPAPALRETESSPLIHFKLADLVQLFCLNGRNIMISVTAETGGVAGEIYIQRGRVIHAVYAGKTGEEGFQGLMRVENSVLKVKDWAAPVPVTIQVNWEHLLLQSAIHFDLHPDQRASGLG